MKVFISIKKGEEGPEASTSSRNAAILLGISPATLQRWLKLHGMYSGKKGKCWMVEVNRIKGRGDADRLRPKM